MNDNVNGLSCSLCSAGLLIGAANRANVAAIPMTCVGPVALGVSLSLTTVTSQHRRPLDPNTIIQNFINAFCTYIHSVILRPSRCSWKIQPLYEESLYAHDRTTADNRQQLIHHTVDNFIIQPDKLALGRINESLATLQQSRELRIRDAENSLRKLSRKLSTLSSQHKEAISTHDSVSHAAEISDLDTKKFRIAKTASEVEIESERLEGELESLKTKLADLEMQGVEGDDQARREREADDATM